MNSGHELKSFAGHNDAVTCLTLLKDGSLVSGSSSDKAIKVWNIKSGQDLETIKGHTSGVYSLALLQDGSLTSGSGDGTIKIWNSN
jgi:WD40 repeat protein